MTANPSHAKPRLPVVWAIEEGRRRGYSSVDRLILIVLANHMNGISECWPSLAALAVECACSPRHIRRTLRRLEADGLIATDQGVGRGFTSRYRLLAETINSAAQPDLFPEARSQKPETLYTPPKPKRPKGGHDVPLSKPKKRTPSPLLPAGKEDSLRTKKRTPSPGESTKENPPIGSTGLRPETAVAVSQNPPPEFDPRKALWTEGRETLRKLTGQMNGEAGKQIGRFLKLANGDAVSVLRALEVAALEQPYEPIPWITAAIKARAVQRGSALDEIRERWNLPTFVTPGGSA